MQLTPEQLEAIPKTTPTDVLSMLLMSLVAGLIWFLFRMPSNLEVKEAHSILGKKRYDETPETSTVDSTVQAVKTFNRSGIGFLNAWLPFLVLVLGYIACAYIRDAGYLIFWWPMFAVHLVFGVALFCATWDRRRRIRQEIGQKPETGFYRE